MERIRGPACPDCGCEDSEPIPGGIFGPQYRRRRCRHCGQKFSAPAEANGSGGRLPATAHDMYPKCTGCGSTKTRVVSTYTKSPTVLIRTYQCGACGGTFQATGSS